VLVMLLVVEAAVTEYDSLFSTLRAR
jgi:hypothetical protein